MVKKIFIFIGIGLLVAGIGSFITQRRADKTIGGLNDRYTTIEESNIKFGNINNELELANSRLRDKLENSNRIIGRTKTIIVELENGNSESKDIIERVENTARAIREIADQLPEEIIILEKDNGI